MKKYNEHIGRHSVVDAARVRVLPFKHLGRQLLRPHNVDRITLRINELRESVISDGGARAFKNVREPDEVVLCPTRSIVNKLQRRRTELEAWADTAQQKDA